MDHHSTERRPPHPIVFLVLYLPFGAFQGYITVTLGYVLRGGGVSVAAIAGLVGLSLLPNTWKVLWAPLVDTTLSAKAWFAIGTGATAAVLLAAAATPMTAAGVPMLSALSFIGGLTSSFAGIAADRVMAYATPPEQQGRAGGWSQAGNLGGQGMGGGLGLWLCQHASDSLGSAGVGLLCLATLPVLLWLKAEDARMHGLPLPALVKATGRDVLNLGLTRVGLLACFICLLPMNTGAVANIWGAMARDWRASADQAAFVGGALSGVVSIVGALAGGYACDKLDRKTGYALFGLASAACAVAMALGPRTPMAFLVFATLYNLIIGAGYGAFAALTLEAIGHGAAATKYNLIASIANVPIMLMTLVDGQAQTAWGAGGMLYTEAGLGVAAVGLYAAAAWMSRGWKWPDMLHRPGGGAVTK